MCMIWYSLLSRRWAKERTGAREGDTPLSCLPRARPFSLSPTTSKRLLRRLDMICSVVQMNRPMCDHLSWQSISRGLVSWCFTYFKWSFSYSVKVFSSSKLGQKIYENWRLLEGQRAVFETSSKVLLWFCGGKLFSYIGSRERNRPFRYKVVSIEVVSLQTQ